MIKFELSEKQENKLKRWQAKIKKQFGKYGNYTFSFKPTGIGDVVEVHSDLLNEKLDLTDVSSW